MRSRAASAVVVALLVLAACGGDDAESVAADEAPVSEDEWRSLPLAQAMGWADRADDGEEEWAAHEREVQERTVECMAALGFEYQPIDHEANSSSFDSYEDLDVEPGSREFAERYGFGISTFFEQEQEVFAQDVGQEFDDPNQEYVDSLSESERDAYYVALYGESPDVDPSLSEEEMNALYEDFVPTGCENEARSEVFGAGYFGGGEESGPMQEFWELQEDLYERVEADPRIVELRAEWQACMSEAGHSFSDEEEMYETLFERMNEVYESQSFPGGDLTEAELEAMPEDELEALYSQPPEFDLELLDEVQADELDLAVADHDCGAASQRLRFEVQRELEAEFVDQHAELIDEVRDEFP